MANLAIKFGQMDPDAKPNIINIASPSIAPWARLSDLGFDDRDVPEFLATLEPNHTVLDGRMEEFPDNVDSLTMGLFSETVSGSDGTFTNPPTLRIDFQHPVRAPGLTFHFYPHTEDYVNLVQVSWWADLAGTELLSEGQFELDGTTSSFLHPVNEYRRVDITFLSTNLPHRYVKLWALEYGLTRTIGDKEIDACRVIERVNPTSSAISINQLTTTIRTRDGIFSPITSYDFVDMMIERQILEVFRDGEPWGLFFLRRWVDVTQDGIVFDIKGEDALSVLDSFEFMGGLYANKLVRELLDELFLICFPTGQIRYILDPEYQETRVSGWIPIGTCGEAFQHIMFAINATADTARQGHVWIYRREEDIKSDGIPSATSEQDWAPAYNLRTHQRPTYFSSFEPNYTLVDGELGELPENTSGINTGWVSQVMSDASGNFATPPKVTLQFSTPHHFRQVELHFGAYANEFVRTMRATFFDEHNNVLRQNTYTFDSNPAIWSDNIVRDFRRIEIEILSTSVPLRFARLSYIDWGKSFFIPLTKQYHRGRDMPMPFVGVVEVVSHEYVPTDEETDVFRGYLPIGQSEIRFREPLHSLQVSPTSATTISQAHDNYAILNVTNPNVEISLVGRKYLDNRRIHAIRAPQRAGGIGEIEEYSGYTLVSPDIGDELSNQLYSHYQQRVNTKISCVLNDLEVGFIAEVETRGKSVVGTIVELIANLRANRCDLEVVGDVMDYADYRQDSS